MPYNILFVDQLSKMLSVVKKYKPKLMSEKVAMQSANKFRFSF